jgi:hypothetical protein
MSKPFYVNPINICSELYGYENVNDVRNCVMDSINRFYGPFCNYHQYGLNNMIQNYMIQILKNAGKNPKAVKLALPPQHLQARFFIEKYLESFDKEKSFEYCIHQCKENKECKLNCKIDKESIKFF